MDPFPVALFWFLTEKKLSDLKDPVPEGSRDFSVEGQRTDLNTIFLKLRIADSTGFLFSNFIFFPLEHACLAGLIAKRYVIPSD